MADNNDGWEDVSHELETNSDGWEDVSHELKPQKTEKVSKPKAAKTAEELLTQVLGPDYQKNQQAFESGAQSGMSLGFKDELKGLGEAISKGVSDKTLDLDTLLNAYRSGRDVSRAEDKELAKTHSGTMLAGNIVGGAPLALGNSLETAALLGSATGLGASEADLTEGDVGGAAKDTAIGALIGGASQYGLDKLKSMGGKLKGAAEKLAEKATGATGSQVSKFEDDAGRQLLDKGYIKAGDTVEDISNRLSKAKQDAGQDIGETLKKLTEGGSNVDVNNVISNLENKVKELSQAPGNETLVAQIQKQIDNLYERGQNNLPLDLAEQAKRNFQGQVNYASPEAEKKAATHIASTFQKEVEQQALAANPELGKKFKDSKELYKLLMPIEEAASKRANTINQQNVFNNADALTFGLGSLGGNPVTGAAAYGAKKFIAPRVASTAAVGADLLGNKLSNLVGNQSVTNPLIQSVVKPKGVEFNDTASVGKEIEKNPSSISSKARELGMNSLADKLDEMSQLPEEQKSQRMFLLMQTPSFRKLINPNGSGSNE